MEEMNVVFCPDCGIYYMKEKDNKIGEEKYTYTDDFVEKSAKKIVDNIYQCAECGAVFELDPYTADNAKPFIKRYRGYEAENLTTAQLYSQFLELFGVNEKKMNLKTVKSFIEYVTCKSNEIDGFLNIDNTANSEEKTQQQKQ